MSVCIRPLDHTGRETGAPEGPWLLPNGTTTGLRPMLPVLVDAAWDEVVAVHPIDPYSPTLRAQWVDKHKGLLSDTYKRLLAEHDGLIEPEPKQLDMFAAPLLGVEQP